MLEAQDFNLTGQSKIRASNQSYGALADGTLSPSAKPPGIVVRRIAHEYELSSAQISAYMA